MPMSKHQLASALRVAGHLVERERFASFVLDEMTAFAVNPFATTTTAGAAHQLWGMRAIEFPAIQVASAGLPCLLAALARLPRGERLHQEILRAGTHVVYAFHHGDGCRVVGAVLHGKPGQALPEYAPSRRRGRSRRPHQGPVQLDLFAML
ncbi:conserved hypothetical protein [Methylobacterium sp. 4-46]|uniref:hypothetical protein n=1 Tax=unclassified Methylobacterium TaxID=2615210 RepID=UPI000165CB46|nr:MULTISPECIES: hypothetical protein [Methylobacterium]ACA21138.1 conserved hypothetical protein [Methylobacterium sp. 4-46]WFT80283.1 hypothetical protein QA634_34825 [Methylobacterium nodulans]